MTSSSNGRAMGLQRACIERQGPNAATTHHMRHTAMGLSNHSRTTSSILRIGSIAEKGEREMKLPHFRESRLLESLCYSPGHWQTTVVIPC